MKAIVKTESTEVVAQQFSTDEINLIKNQIAKGASDIELKYFLELCRQTGLNPFTRQIYLIERKSWNAKTQQWETSRVPQTSIDGFRAIADDSAQYAGQVGPYWCGPDGEWHDVWVKDEFPVAARVGVLRHGFTEPLWAVAKFKEYCQRTKDGHATKMWATMPDLMVAKCAEALALRKAFPQKLGGLYTGDEMAQATVIEQEPDPQPTTGPSPAIAPPTPAAAAAVAIAQQGEEKPPEEPGAPKEIALGEKPDWIWFGQTVIELAKQADWPDWDEKNRANFERMEKEAPKVYKRMVDAIAGKGKKGKKKADEKPKVQPELKDDPEAYLKWLKEQCDWFVDEKKSAADLQAFAAAQANIISAGFPPDQAAANDLIKVAAQALG